LLFFAGGDSAGSLLNPDTIIYNNLYKDVSPSFIGDLPVPAGYIFMSPVTSTLKNCSSIKENAKKDYVANGLGWVEAFDNANPSLEPKPWAFLKEEKLGAQIPKRVLVFVGGHELKRDENILVAETFKKAGADTTVVQENYAHNWFLLADSIVDETDVIEKSFSTYFDWIVQTVQQA
jgi:acetyl esterase/lipase